MNLVHVVMQYILALIVFAAFFEISSTQHTTSLFQREKKVNIANV